MDSAARARGARSGVTPAPHQPETPLPQSLLSLPGSTLQANPAMSTETIFECIIHPEPQVVTHRKNKHVKLLNIYILAPQYRPISRERKSIPEDVLSAGF